MGGIIIQNILPYFHFLKESIKSDYVDSTVIVFHLGTVLCWKWIFAVAI